MRAKFFSWRRGMVFFCLWLVLLGGTAFAGKRETQALTLSNGLDVLLMHDPEVHRSAAALAVGVGMLYDTEDAQGLAHYLEHMLFLGTEKFPEADSYKKYLAENSGASNAYTDAAVTNYFFDVSHEAFDGALDRFSDFFKAPRFDKEFAEREINAVSSEHDKNKSDDGWRAERVHGLISEPGHPLRRFGTGTKETLAGVTRDKLLAFYNRYYSASNMKLVLLSSLTLKEQEALARRHFEGIRNFPVTHPEIPADFRRPLQGRYRLLKVKTLKDLRVLSLEFPTIRLSDHHESKPEVILGWILGYEGKGSLLSHLKNEGLALGLMAGGGSSHPNVNSINITVSLTALGVEQYEYVLERVFAYIELLRKHGVEEYSFREQQSMAQIDFDWKDPEEGMGYVAGKAATMHRYSLKDVETLPYLFKKYDPAAYKAVLDTLVPENLLVTLETNDVATGQVEEFYGTEYSLTEVGGAKFDRLKRPGSADGMSYPEPNRFIPHDLRLVEERPHLVKDDAMGRMWFQFDHRFNQPKVSMTFKIETPLVYDTVRHYAMAKLYAAAVQEGLNEEVYPIEMAGMGYKISLDTQGVEITLGGYSQRLGDLIGLVSANLLRPKVDEAKFADIKESILMDLQNRKKGQAYMRGMYYSGLLLFEKVYGEDELISAIRGLSLEDVRRYAGILYARAYLTGAAYGNWSEAEVRKSVDSLLRGIKSRPLPQQARYKPHVIALPAGEKINFTRGIEDNNNSISILLYAGERNPQNQARADLIASIIESDFFTQLRTNQQLGYMVWNGAMDMENREYLQFIIQSAEYGAFDLKKRLEAWMTATDELFARLTPEEFNRYKEALIVSLEKKGDSIPEVLGEMFHFATRRDGDFDYRRKQVRAVRAMTLEEVREAARGIFVDAGRLALLMRARNNSEPVPPGTLTEVADFKKRIRGKPGKPAVPARTH